MDPKQVHLDSVNQFNKKIESLNHEYNTILIKTLENQRFHFETQIKGIWDSHNAKIEKGKEEISKMEVEIDEEDIKI
jgi:hypothetical protein